MDKMAKNKKKRFLGVGIGAIAAIGLFTIAILLAFAASGSGGGAAIDQNAEGNGGEVTIAASTVTTSINYQGRLTDSAGNPLSGTYTMTFSLYDVASWGTALDTDTHTVEVTDGLFNTEIDFAQGHFDGRELWLGITVGSDSEMMPRQELRPVPYALSLRPGAVIKGSIPGFVLEVKNTRGTAGGRGVRVETNGDRSRGVFAETTGDNSHGVYASTSGNVSHGVYASTDGDYSHGVYAYTSGDISRGVYAYTSGDCSDGVVAKTTGNESGGVCAYTYGHGSEGVFAYTFGDSSSGVVVKTTGDRSRGVFAETTGDNSYGVSVRTDGFRSMGVFASTDGDNSYGVYASTDGANSDGVYAHSAKSYGVHATGERAGIYAKGTGGGYAAEFDGNVIIHTGRVITPVLEITGGSDLSEQFEIRGIEADVSPSPGMVVSIDPERPGELMVSNNAYDRRVAGIISGAGGLNLGMLMGQNGSEADGGYPVALSGRVYCWADASGGPIEPGDLLTTSETPGHAMKVTDHDRAYGAIIGKAMTGLEEGKGLVLVLVALQ